MTQAEVFDAIKLQFTSRYKNKPLCIAINGIEGSGKTIFAGHLTQYLNSKQCNAMHISIDGFHYDRVHRYRQGKDSALGYYEDSYDENAFVQKVLLLSQGDKPAYIAASHDLETDRYLDLPPVYISPDTILITDGAYLFKPVYLAYWDVKIYLHTDFDTAMIRGAARDQDALGGYDGAILKFKNRYHAASKIYQSKVNPESIADMIIDNTDFNNPMIVKL